MTCYMIPMMWKVQNRQITVETESRLMVSTDVGLGRGKLEVTANGYKFSFWGDKLF